MTAPLWKSYAGRPLGVGGVLQTCAWAEAGSTAPEDAVLATSVLVAPTAVSWGDPSAVEVDRQDPPAINGLSFQQGLPAGPVVLSFFAQTADGWQAGPVVDGIDLRSTWTAEFDYPKQWAVDTLKQMEVDTHPLGDSTRLEVRSSFPRDDIPLPCISIQFEAAPQAQRLLGNAAQRLSAQVMEERIPWNVNITTVLWCETPEDRDMLAPWFGEAMQALSALAPFTNLAEPVYQMQESEDFSRQLMEKPIFLLTGTLSGIVWSKLTLPIRNWLGHLTV